MSWDNTWESIFNESDWGKYPGEELIRFIAKNYYPVQSRQDIRILEIGSGTGANLWYLQREGFSVYGIEGSSIGVEKTKARLNNEFEEWSGEVRVGDFTDLPYQDNFFDVVIDNGAVCCNSYDDSKKAYSEAYRVLKNNGKIYVRTFSLNCWGYEQGEKVGHNAFIVDQGPIKGLGYVRFTHETEFVDLLKNYQIEEINLISRTLNNMKHKIEEYIVVAQK